MLPYWFSALTMKSVGKAANAMVIEIKRQFDANPNLLIPNHPDRPDYDTCIKISTGAELKKYLCIMYICVCVCVCIYIYLYVYM